MKTTLKRPLPALIATMVCHLLKDIKFPVVSNALTVQPIFIAVKCVNFMMPRPIMNVVSLWPTGYWKKKRPIFAIISFYLNQKMKNPTKKILFLPPIPYLKAGKS